MMQYSQRLMNRTVGDDSSDAMSLSTPKRTIGERHSDATVPILITRSTPQPARTEIGAVLRNGTVAVNLFPEPLNERRGILRLHHG